MFLVTYLYRNKQTLTKTFLDYFLLKVKKIAMSLYFENSLSFPAGDGPAESENCGDWYVTYTQPKSEAVAAENLKRQGFDVYLPLYRIYRKYPVDVASQSVPMFARHIFFRPGHVTLSIATARSLGVSHLYCRLAFKWLSYKISNWKRLRPLSWHVTIWTLVNQPFSTRGKSSIFR